MEEAGRDDCFTRALFAAWHSALLAVPNRFGDTSTCNRPLNIVLFIWYRGLFSFGKVGGGVKLSVQRIPGLRVAPSLCLLGGISEILSVVPERRRKGVEWYMLCGNRRFRCKIRLAT